MLIVVAVEGQLMKTEFRPAKRRFKKQSNESLVGTRCLERPFLFLFFPFFSRGHVVHFFVDCTAASAVVQIMPACLSASQHDSQPPSAKLLIQESDYCVIT